MTFSRRTIVLLFAVALGITFTPSGTMAQGVPGEILIIHALEAEGAIDPSLSGITALQRPPFNSYRTMRLLSRPSARFTVGASSEFDLPNGRRLRVTLDRVSEDGRFHIRVSINRPNQGDYLREARLVAAPGDPFFVAGQTHEGGMLLIGIKIGTSPSR